MKCEVNTPKMDGSTMEMDFPLLLPEKVVKYLIEDCGLQVPPSRLKEYWEHLESLHDPWALETKAYRSASEVPVIPLGFYGDEANMGFIGVQEKIIGLTLNLPLFRPKSTRFARYSIFSIRSDLVVDPVRTFYPVLRQIVISFNKLSDEFVSCANFLVSEIRGDQAWFRYLLQHKAYWAGNEVCFRCKANVFKNYDFTDYSESAGWRTTYRNTAELIADQLPLPLCNTNLLRNLWAFGRLLML